MPLPWVHKEFQLLREEIYAIIKIKDDCADRKDMLYGRTDEKGNLAEHPQSEDAYRSIHCYVIETQRQVYTAVNAAMVTAYWKIGKSIFETCGENDRAAYGKQVLQYISARMTEKFGKGFNFRNLRYMRQFYLRKR